MESTEKIQFRQKIWKEQRHILKICLEMVKGEEKVQLGSNRGLIVGTEGIQI